MYIYEVDTIGVGRDSIIMVPQVMSSERHAPFSKDARFMVMCTYIRIQR